MDRPLSGAAPSADDLRLMDAWWRAANYLSVGQIYLLGNPLLERPIERADLKPRLLGRFGTTPGLNFIYVHLNRVIKARDLDVIYICGPGHGGPGMVANTWLEGTYSELNPSITQNAEGMRRLFRQFSFPGGIPSHAAPETPGSIKLLEDWMRSYRPQELFDHDGRLRPEIAALAPEGDRRMSANPHTNGGLLRRELMMPDFVDYAVTVTAPGQADGEATRVMGVFLRDVMKHNHDFRLFDPDETASNRLSAVC